MTSWEFTFVASCVQITVLAGLVASAYACVPAGNPRIARHLLVVGIFLVFALTIAAWVPLPNAWSLTGIRETAPEQMVKPNPVGTNRIHSRIPGMVLPLNRIESMSTSFLRMVEDSRSEPGAVLPTSGIRWRFIPILLIGLGVLFSMLRFGVAVTSTYRIVRRSSRIQDPAFLELVDDMVHRIGCRPVELRASDHVYGAATVGWCRPVLLVAADYIHWSREELQAVIAHELTHVQKHDFVVAALARLTVCLHFYHPLVRWLVGRLLLAQESVADANAAALVDGRASYLAVLSRIALRQDRQITLLPVPGFGSSSNSILMRRIKMLQTRDGSHPRLLRISQLLAVSSLCVAAVALSTLRVPAEEENAKKPTKVRVANKDSRRPTSPPGSITKTFSLPNTKQRPEIDLRCALQPKDGVLVLRPSEIFGRAELAQLTEKYDALINDKLRSLGVGEDIQFSVSAIEQATGPISIQIDDRHASPGKRGKLVMGLGAIRMSEPFPFKDVVTTLSPGTTETDHGDFSVLDSPAPPLPGLGPLETSVVVGSKELIPGANAESYSKRLESGVDLDKKPWFGDWKTVEQSVLSAVIDTSDWDWAAEFGSDIDTSGKSFANPTQCTKEECVALLVEELRYVVCGIDWRGDTISLQALANFKSDERAAEVATGLEKLIQIGSTMAALHGSVADEAEDPLAKLLAFSAQALDTISVNCKGNQVRLVGTTKLDPKVVETLLEMFLGEMTGEA